MKIYKEKEINAFYKNIYLQNKELLLKGGSIDKYLLPDILDKRMSLVLLIRIPPEISEEIKKYITNIKKIEPNLYYYPEKDFHITVMSILKGRQNRRIPINIDEYVQCIGECVNEISPFYIEFRGMTASDNAAMITGYYESDLEKLRKLLREKISNKQLIIEEKYKTFSSHITVIRMPCHLTKPKDFTQYIETENYFGCMKVEQIQLVFHNCYDSSKIILKTFIL